MMNVQRNVKLFHQWVILLSAPEAWRYYISQKQNSKLLNSPCRKDCYNIKHGYKTNKREENKQLIELNNNEIRVLLRGLKQMITDSHQF